MFTTIYFHDQGVKGKGGYYDCLAAFTYFRAAACSTCTFFSCNLDAFRLFVWFFFFFFFFFRSLMLCF